ncbi:MAG: hypoxanthine-guanine phosphoribosyltransferase [Methylophaga sp.]
MQLTEAMPRDAECLYTLTEIDAVLSTLAAQLNRDYADKNPLLLCVMNGAVITMGQLLPKLDFALQIDYIHASRYGDKTVGGELVWQAQPQTAMAGRHVLLIEDIYDEGHTLIALREFCQQQGALSVACLALADKQHARKSGQPPEYIGLSVADRYVFGFGMDVQGYWRNAPGIFAMTETN